LQNPLAAHSVVVVFKVVRVTSVVKTAPHKLLSDLTSVQKVVYQERLAVMHTGILISDASIEFTGQVVVDTILLPMVLLHTVVTKTLKDIQDSLEPIIHLITAGRKWEWLTHLVCSTAMVVT
jgi:5-methylcytosine-specific restriction endonuclease McrA